MTSRGMGGSTARTRWSRRLLRWISWLVPRDGRRDWLDEWEAELWHLGSGDRGRYLMGALWHATWERWEGWSMDSIGYDVRYALRTLRRSPGFTFTAVLLLGLGIGASTSLFSVVEEAVLAAPPYPDPDRLVVVDALFGMPDGAMTVSTWSYPRFEAYRAQATTLESAAGYVSRTGTLTDLGDASVIGIEAVTPSYFRVLGVDATRGRVFGADEEDRGAPAMVALVSNAFWRTRIGGSPDAVGGTLTVDGQRLDVVGVLPAGFAGLGGTAEVWVPLSVMRAFEDAAALEDPWNQYFSVIGRLAAGASIEQARAEANAFGATIMDRFPPPAPARDLVASADVVPFVEARVNPASRASMIALFGAVTLMLLAATANLAALLLTRGAGRQNDAAVRASLGAGRARLMRQTLSESLILALAGGALGLGLAWAGIDILSAWLAEAVGTAGSRGLLYIDPARISLDWRVAGFAVLLTGGVGLLFGSLPAWYASRTDPASMLRAGRAPFGTRTGMTSAPARSGLVALQIALTLVLLTGATLMLRSITELQRSDPGYDANGLLGATYALTQADLDAGVQPASFHTQFLDRIRALPGVRAAAVGEVPMAGPMQWTIVMGSEGRPDLIPQMHVRIRVQPVSDLYLETLGVTLIEGRDIRATDSDDAETVVLLNRTAANTLFPDGGAIGRHIQLPYTGFGDVGARVVGIVEDLQYGQPGGAPELQAFVSLRQAPQLAVGLIVRADGDPGALAGAVRSALAQMDADIALTSVMSMDDRLASVTARPRIVLSLLSLFAILALLLVAAGLYGVISFNVARRTRELGLRASIGADPASLRMLVLRHALVVCAVGLLIGAIGAFWLTPFLESLLFGVAPLDPIAFAGAIALLAFVALAASYLPARRATRIDPMRALRSE